MESDPRTMKRSFAALLLVAATCLGAALSYGVGEVRLATARTETAVLQMDAWLRLAARLEGEQPGEVKDLVDLNLDGALATIILNKGLSRLDDRTAQQLQEGLARLDNYWTSHPPYAGVRWASSRASQEWRDAFASRMAFLKSQPAAGAER